MAPKKTNEEKTDEEKTITEKLMNLDKLNKIGGLEKNKEDVESMDKRKMATFKRQATGQHTNLFTLGFDSKVKGNGERGAGKCFDISMISHFG